MHVIVTLHLQSCGLCVFRIPFNTQLMVMAVFHACQIFTVLMDISHQENQLLSTVSVHGHYSRFEYGWEFMKPIIPENSHITVAP